MKRLLKSRKYIFLMAVLLFVSVLSACAGQDNQDKKESKQNAVESAIKTKTSGILTVGMCATWPPFEYRDAKGEIIGFDVDMAQEIGKDLGLTIKFEDADWQGLVPSLQKGDYDILISCFAASEKREETVAFSDIYYDLPSTIVIRDDNKNIKNKEDLKGKVVGVQLGTADEMAAENLNKSIGFKELKKFKLPPDEFLDLKQGGIDAVVVGLPYAAFTIKDKGGFALVGEPFDPQPCVMLVNSNNQDLLKAVNDSLARMKKDGSYDALLKKWMTV